MSFLSDLIKDVRKELLAPDPDLNATVDKFRNGIINRLRALHDEDNLRIFASGGGGIIRGAKGSRITRENREKGTVLCQEARLTDGNEVPYFRAVFNLQDHTFTIGDNPQSIVRLIGYESPLMRKKRESGSRTLSCDLVGLTSDDRVLCIEGKVNPNNELMDIVYGLLESYAYGVGVDFFLAEEGCRELFKREIRDCLKEFHPKAGEFDGNKLTAAFALAAPREYFGAYFARAQMGNGKARRCLCEVEELLSAFRGGGPEWSGFLIMSSPCSVASFDAEKGRTTRGEYSIEPHFKAGSFRVGLAGDLKTLEQRCKTYRPLGLV